MRARWWWSLAVALAACDDDVVAPTLVGATGGGATADVVVLADGALLLPDGNVVAPRDGAGDGDAKADVPGDGFRPDALPDVLSDGAVADLPILDAGPTDPGGVPDGADLPPDGQVDPLDGAIAEPPASDLPDTGAPPDAQGDDVPILPCTTGADCPPGWTCVKTPFGNVCAEPVCSATGPELCDGTDNDCDGAVDESTCDDANICTQDNCVGAAGCQNVAKAGPCDLDGDPCSADACKGEKCAAGPQKACDDGNACTFDLCAAGACQHKPQGLSACDDGNLCTAGDKCTAGVCQPGGPVSCQDGNPCTDDVCFPATGKCLHANAAAGVPCSDGNLCTNPDTCLLGACAGKPVGCEDGNPCTADTCAPATGCGHPPLDGAPCNDNNTCTAADVCKAGVCGGGKQTCDDANPCTQDGCTPSGGCSHAPVVGACNDGDVCTKGETCGPGGCSGGVLTPCNDGNPCTADVCDPLKGCAYVPATGPCNDGNPCTLIEVCQGGSCAPQKFLDCNDNIACTADTCDATLAGCLHKPKVEACDDGDICTVDQCLTATGCKHTAIEKCCGGKQCAATEVCIQYPDTLAPLCAKACKSGADCPTGSCCFMTFKTKHCLVAPYLDQCCKTPEYWATDDNPYACGTGGKGKCVNYPNPQPPYYPSKLLYCTTACKTNDDCPLSCCGTTTMGSHQCVNPDYKKLFCPG